MIWNERVSDQKWVRLQTLNFGQKVVLRITLKHKTFQLNVARVCVCVCVCVCFFITLVFQGVAPVLVGDGQCACRVSGRQQSQPLERIS